MLRDDEDTGYIFIVTHVTFKRISYGIISITIVPVDSEYNSKTVLLLVKIFNS